MAGGQRLFSGWAALSEAGRQAMKWDALGLGVPWGGMSPRRAGSESPIGSCQEKPLQNILSALLRPDDFHSAAVPAFPCGMGVIFPRGLSAG